MTISIQTRQRLQRLSATSLKAKTRTNSRKKQTIKPSTIGLYASAFVFVVTLVAIGYRPPQSETTVATVTETMPSSSVQQTSVNEIVATAIAANMAEATNLSVANNVANLSVSLTARSELAQADDTSITKPQIVQPADDRREIITHVAKAGDTVDSLSARYGVSKDTIRWANDLTSDAIEEGKKLSILPVDGVVYTVKGGDNVKSIAEKYKANQDRIVAFNDLELGGFNEGVRIIIPAGELPETERPGYVAPRAYSPAPSTVTSVTRNFANGSVGNRYAIGYCTWYAYERRAALGRPVGSFWGNANTWSVAAAGQGYRVNNTPAIGAVLQTVSGGGGYGHVGVVESIDAAGNVTISEMNYAGWNVISSRTIPAGQASSYAYIH